MSVAPRSVMLERFAPWLMALLVLAVAIWASQPYPAGVFHDDGVYVILGKALASGEGYRYLHLPGTPDATHYPPGYPLLLALLWVISPEFPGNVALFQLANAILLSLTAVGVAVFARRVLDWGLPAALAAGLASTLTYPLLGLSAHVLSELMFVALLFPLLVLAERAVRDGAEVMDAGIAGAAAGALSLVRTNAIAFLLALLLVLVLRRRFRLAGIAVVAALMLLGPWQLWVLAYDGQLPAPLRGAYGSYLPWLLRGLADGGVAFVFATVGANVREIAALLGDRFSLSDHALPRQLTASVVALLAVVGLTRAARRAPVTVAFYVIYLAIVIVWPWNPWRFLYAVWPILILSLGVVAHWLFQMRRARLAVAGVGLAGMVLLLAGVVRADGRAYRNRSWYGPARDAAARIAPSIRWVSDKTRPTDLVAVEGEPIVYLFTGRKAVPSVSFVPSQYLENRSLDATVASMREVLTTFPASYLSAITLDGFQAARVLATPMPADSLAPRLVELEQLAGQGGFFRVERGSLVPRP